MRKSCTEPVMNQETTYLTRLGNALQWRYDGGYLAVFYKLEGDTFGELLFAPSTP
jgi:heat shock protein HslJ